MPLTDARRLARVGPDGALIPMAEQDRTLWNAGYIEQGVALISTALTSEALARGGAGPHQLQAAIAAIHDEAPDAASTDWPQIVALYELLLEAADNPVVSLNHAVAVGMASGPRAGLEPVEKFQHDDRIGGDHRIHAVRAYLLEMAGDRTHAHDAYLDAAIRAMSIPQQRYLRGRAARLNQEP